MQLIDGRAKFTQEDRHTLAIEDSFGRTSLYSADFILITCGTRPARRDDFPFDALQVYDSDEFIQVTQGELPKSIIVVGGGVIGMEYASMVAALGSFVTVVEARETDPGAC